MKLLTSLAVGLIGFSSYAFGSVSFVTPKDGQTVKNPITVKFDVKGMKVVPAGKVMPGTGHHHLIIDSKHIAKGTVVPADEKHMHFGKGQTETAITLPKGKHHLTLQFADGTHTSYGSDYSKTIEITVE